MIHNLLSDKPVCRKDEDKFQRYDFSKRIAERIKSTESEDSIVIGIDGEWGEGKTSIMQFIESELTNEKDIVTVKFNPWRFNDEATLLASFFIKVASAISPSLLNNKKGKFYNKLKRNPLQKNHEKLGEFLSKWGSIMSPFGIGGVKDVGKELAGIDLETLKKRFEDLLRESKKKLVVFIDDIDRLDKNEVYSIFRLVKLNADFSNTYYIMSFDTSLVAASIGQKFGNGDVNSGLVFLEKIIQVPLKIPRAQKKDLLEYTFELLNKVLENSGIDLPDEEAKNVGNSINEFILPRLKTPRMAVQYSNSLSFALPLLKGEVNISDLILIEAIKIFYPKHHEFIKTNSELFIKSYNSSSAMEHETEQRKKVLNENIESLGKNLSVKEQDAIKDLLQDLFPVLGFVFSNYIENNSKWYIEKRIASPEYFERYFSYSVLKGELSDISFEEFLNALPSYSIEDIVNKIRSFVDLSNCDTVLDKLGTHIEKIDWENLKKTALAIANLGDIFIEDYSGFLIFSNPRIRASVFIYHILKKQSNEEKRLSFAKKVIKEANPFEYAFEIFNWFNPKEKDGKYSIFSQEETFELSKMLIDRALKESNGTPVFFKFKHALYRLSKDWKQINEKEFTEYVDNILKSNPKKVMQLLETFTSTYVSDNVSYFGNFSIDNYKYFIELFDKEYIYNILNEVYSQELMDEPIFDEFKQNNGINIIRQFNHWYQKESKGEVKSNE